MRHLLVSLLVACLASSAFGGANPNIRIYLEADPNFHVHEIYPVANDIFDVYVCVDCFGDDPVSSGTRGTAFLLVRTFQGFKLSQMSLFPGGLDFGDAEVDGWTLAAGPDCLYPGPDGIACVGVIEYLYVGVPGTLDLVPHPGTGREILDCDFNSDYWCIHANLGVGVPPNPADPCCEDCFDCPQQNPDVGIAVHVDYEGHDCSFHLSDCNFIQTAWPLVGQPTDFMIMNCYFPYGFTGDEYSIVYPPEWVFLNWQDCSDYQTDPYDGTSGDGVIQWWDQCQPAPGPAGGPHTIGILTLMPTTPGRVSIWTHPATGLAGVYSFVNPPTLDEVLPWETVGNGRAGWVDVGGGPGCNPCICVGEWPNDPCWPQVSPVRDATWGSIKAMYR